MAVERLTDYTRRIWTGLAADAPDPDMQVGDVIYYMDTSTCSIITGIPAPGSIDTEDLPDVGGGGGGGVAPADMLLTCKNNIGYMMSQVQTTMWMSAYDMWGVNTVSNKNTGTMIYDHAPNRVQRLTDGRLAVYLYITTGSNYTPGPVTYNDEPLETVINGSLRYYTYKIYLPDDYDPDIPIVIN